MAQHDPQDVMRRQEPWQGPTYYGRSQLKASVFENWVVGGYVFLAGVSGTSALLAAIMDFSRGAQAAETVRRGRYLALLAPTIGSGLLVYDLYSPKRFYNMLRIFKRTSPMSIGSWTLMGFSLFAGCTAAAQFFGERSPRLRRVARVTQWPAAIAGAGLATYTASLLSATSTPLWAAAPEAMAVRFASSSIAAGAAALSLAERSRSTRRKLDTLKLAALAAELAATQASHAAYRRKGVAPALAGRWGGVERVGATGMGTVIPLSLQAAGRGDLLANLAIMAGSLLLRVALMSAGDESARRPDISFKFAQPENLP